MKESIRLIQYSLQCIVCATLFFGQQVWAENDNISFAGFASFVYAKTITDDKKKGAFSGMSNDGEYRDFNKLGFRMEADLKDNLTFTAQVIAEGSSDYDPTFDWIFATYHITPSVSVSVGKYRVPVFMYSDYLDTSYAYQWIAPPITVYNAAQTPFKSMEGVKISYLAELGGAWTSELLLWGGKADDVFKENGVDDRLLLEDALGIAWTVEREWLSLRAFYFEAETSLDVTTNPVLDDLIYGSYGGEYVAGATGTPVGTLPSITDVEAGLSLALGKKVNLHDDFLWQKDPGQFYGIGAGLEFEYFFMKSEITRIEVDTSIVTPVMDSWYVMAGVRLPGSVTLSLTYGEDKDRATKDVYEQFDQYVALDPSLAAYQDAIKQFTETVQKYDIKTTTLTTRWDFHRSASLKFEYLIHDWEYSKNNTETPHAVRVGLDLVF